MNIINACSVFGQFADRCNKNNEMLPLLAWKEAWSKGSGQGIVAGLLDTDFDESLPDLTGSDLIVKNFSGCNNNIQLLKEHGTYSVATLIGQGNYQMRGLVPNVQLLVAKVVGADGAASPQLVAEALAWLISAGAQIIVLPLGEAREHKEISLLIEKGFTRGVMFFAAAGNYYPDPIVYPACHPMVIAVGAIDLKGNLLGDCCREPQLDLAAPGWKIAAPIGGGLIARRGGSSVACVIAAGAAIMALSTGDMQWQSLNRTKLLANLLRENVVRPPPHC